jgi:hypothetical protein
MHTGRSYTEELTSNKRGQRKVRYVLAYEFDGRRSTITVSKEALERSVQ